MLGSLEISLLLIVLFVVGLLSGRLLRKARSNFADDSSTRIELFIRESSDRRFTILLVVSLISLAAVFLAISKPINRSDLFLNLSTEIVGILVTVGFVTWLIGRREKARREPAYRYVRFQMVYLAEIFSLVVSGEVNIRFDPYDQINEIRKRELIEEISVNLLLLNKDSVEWLGEYLKERRAATADLYERHSHLLSDEDSYQLLRLDQAILWTEERLQDALTAGLANEPGIRLHVVQADMEKTAEQILEVLEAASEIVRSTTFM